MKTLGPLPRPHSKGDLILTKQLLYERSKSSLRAGVVREIKTELIGRIQEPPSDSSDHPAKMNVYRILVPLDLFGVY
jgi:hypothetical protein